MRRNQGAAKAQARGLPVVAALLVAAALAACVFRFVTLRMDMLDFLPAGSGAASRLMLQELRSGPATSLILLGIQNAPPDELARISLAMTTTLGHSGDFSFVENGRKGLDEAALQYLFSRRYLLSPVTSAAAFAVPALRKDFQHLLGQLQSPAGFVTGKFGLADPVGAFSAMTRIWLGGSHVRLVHGVWFAPHRDRALILARTSASGMELAAQSTAVKDIRAAFAQARPGSAQLLLSGPAVIARDTANAIRGDVRLISIIATLLVVALLIWRFRSPLVIAAIAVPVILGVTVAALAVQLIFGFVHGIALGFGMTMLGVTVDYPVLLIGHRKQAEAAPATLRRIGAAFNLAVATAALGLTGMVFSGVPGLAQLGVFSVCGVLVAALTTRLLLPRLIVAADLAPVAAGDPVRLLRIERLRAVRLLAVFPVAAAIAWLIWSGGPQFERDLANLSPVPPHARQLDAELRGELGAPDPGQVVIVQGKVPEAVLRREEALLPRIDRLRQAGVIDGAELAARFLPSTATQRARQAALPAPDVLAQRVAEAAKSLPFRSDAFNGFVADVGASRTMPPVTLAGLKSPLMRARLQPLLFAADGEWLGVVVPKGVKDAEQLAAAFAHVPDATYVDIRAESSALVASYTSRAWRWLGFGGVAATIVLAVGLRDIRRLARVLAVLGMAGAVTLAALTALGEQLSLIHIVSLQFVAGVGLDYALFFSRPQLDAEERARTLRTLVTCNAMTLLTFGLLAACRTPLLREIGITVAIGAAAAMVFAFLIAGPWTGRRQSA